MLKKALSLSLEEEKLSAHSGEAAPRSPFARSRVASDASAESVNISPLTMDLDFYNFELRSSSLSEFSRSIDADSRISYRDLFQEIYKQFKDHLTAKDSTGKIAKIITRYESKHKFDLSKIIPLKISFVFDSYTAHFPNLLFEVLNSKYSAIYFDLSGKISYRTIKEVNQWVDKHDSFRSFIYEGSKLNLSLPLDFAPDLREGAFNNLLRENHMFASKYGSKIKSLEKVLYNLRQYIPINYDGEFDIDFLIDFFNMESRREPLDLSSDESDLMPRGEEDDDLFFDLEDCEATSLLRGSNYSTLGSVDSSTQLVESRHSAASELFWEEFL